MKLFRLLTILSLVLLVGVGCNSNQNLDSKLKCQELGEKYYSELKAKESFGGSVYSTIEYGYSKKLNTCLYTGRAVNAQGDSLEYILDLLTNKTILSIYIIDGKPSTDLCDTCVSSFVEFENKQKELFK